MLPKLKKDYFPASDNCGYAPITDSIKVDNLPSRATGEGVKNQFVIRYPKAGIVKFQSYSTTCLVYDYVSQVLAVYPEAFGFSVTTSKHARVFLEDIVGFTPEMVDSVKKFEKGVHYGHDCPLFLTFDFDT